MATTKKVAYYWKEGNNIDFLAVGTQSQLLTADANGAPTWATGLTGTTTNDNAAAGQVGEYVSSIVLVGSAVSLTTATPAMVTSLTMTAGDWDVWGEVWYNPGSGTVFQATVAAIASISGGLPSTPADGTARMQQGQGTIANDSVITIVGPCRGSFSATSTLYLNTDAFFTVSTCSAYGKLCARRVR